MHQNSHGQYYKALNKIQRGNYGKATRILEDLLLLHPKHPDVLHLLGVCYLESDHIDSAMDCLEKAAITCPDNARFQYHYGLSLIKSTRLKSASMAFQSALEIDNTLYNARFNLGKVYKDLGRYQDAVEAYEALLGCVPGHIDALYNLANLYADMNDYARASFLYDKLLTIDPQHMNARANLGLIFSKTGRGSEAINELEQVLHMDPENEFASQTLRKLNSRLIPAWHFDMLNDDIRNIAYDRAIRNTVTSSSHVLEIGTGSGLLAMMAARAGARQVTTCEMVTSLADCARKVVRCNGYEDRVRVIGKKSTSLEVGLGKDLDEKADVLIAEVFDVGLLGEQFLPALIHAKENLLTQDAVFIPAAAKIKCVLAECPDLRKITPLKAVAGFDLSEFDMFRAPGYRQFDMWNTEHRVLSEPFDALDINFKNVSEFASTGHKRIRCLEKGMLQAIIFWFELFGDTEILYTSNHKGGRNHWKQAIYFLQMDYPVMQDEIIQLEIQQRCADLSFKVV
ncbi:MAG: tetratricopeptide repeat protein [Desulfobacteraceae bacterium]|nr:tetratricopeptide repeat protein [Desulfobacteraceae bacterium]